MPGIMEGSLPSEGQRRTTVETPTPVVYRQAVLLDWEKGLLLADVKV